MQQAFDIGAERALGGGVLSAISRAAGEQILLDTAFRNAVSMARLHKVAFTLLHPAYALRRTLAMHISKNRRPVEPAYTWVGGDSAPSQVLSPTPSGTSRLGDSVIEKLKKPAKGDRTVTHRTSETGAVARAAAGANAILRLPAVQPNSADDKGIVPLASVRAAQSVRTGFQLHRPTDAAKPPRGASDLPRGPTWLAHRRDRDSLCLPSAMPVFSKTDVNRKFSHLDAMDGRDAATSPPVNDDRGAAPGEEGGSWGRTSHFVSLAPRVSRSSAAGARAATDLSNEAGKGRVFSRHTSRPGVEATGNADSALGVPAPQDGAPAANGGAMEGDVFLDGALMGRWISRLLTRDAERASVGRTGFDIRRGRLLPGPTVGAQ